MDIDALFEAFAFASEVPKILQLFEQICAVLEVDQTDAFNIYESLKNGIRSWRAEKLWAHLDKRAGLKEYCAQKACKKLAVLVVGGGPCGLRAAIECGFLGAHVVLVEQRESFFRNNVLHLWPFVIQDLKNIGIKVFYPKFCRGSIDHISIRHLQCSLLKLALVLGVQFHNDVAFQNLIYPEANENKKVIGWRADFRPANHILSSYVFDALIGADGKKSIVPGFPKTEMRGKLAIGITANFVNRGTGAEEVVQEISGIAYIFNQKFFNDMKAAANVDLENIVYYKDETHYFVMCAKKQSLLDRGVIIKDYDDISLLLSSENVDQEKLCGYAVAAANYATNYKLPDLTFAQTCNGKSDVAVFDFTSLYSAKYSVRVIERFDRRLLVSIVGDSLHEPFWPSGSGCARGFLGVFDVAWMLRNYGLGNQSILQLIAERENVYKLLAQAKPENLQKKLDQYTIDPRSRYLNLEVSVQPYDVRSLVDTDSLRSVEINEVLPLRVDEGDDLLDSVFLERYKLMKFCQQALQPFKLKVHNFDECWYDGRALGALLAKFRPEIINYIGLCFENDVNVIFQRLASVSEEEYGIKCQFKSAREWMKLDTNERVDFIKRLVFIFKADRKRMEEILLNSIRASAAIKMKNLEHRVDSSDMNEFSPVRQQPNKPLSKSPSWPRDIRDELLVRDFLEGHHEELQEHEISELLKQLGKEDLVKKMETKQGIRNYGFHLNAKFICDNINTKHYTKRPIVDKLDPQRLNAVERIITGEVEAEKTRELYRRKQRGAKVLARKMDKRDITEMEEKLKRTAIGLLLDKKHYRVITSKEEKIISTNAAAARQVAKEGFRSDEEKFKDVDAKLHKADLLLKNNDLAGVDAVTRMRQQNANLFAKRRLSAPLTKAFSKPVPLPKRVQVLKSASSRDPKEVASVDHYSKKTLTSYQHTCQLCHKSVYLAEQIQVEGFYLHRSCFRCAFCQRPLRIGHCGQDRNLEKYYPRFFCMQHLNLPLHEKFVRIETLELAKSGKAEIESLVSSNKMIRRPKVDSSTTSEYGIGRSARLEKLSNVYKNNSHNPSVILEKTLEKMRLQKNGVKTSELGESKLTSITSEDAVAGNKLLNKMDNVDGEKDFAFSESTSTSERPNTISISYYKDSSGKRNKNLTVCDDSSTLSEDISEIDQGKMEKTFLGSLDNRSKNVSSDEQLEVVNASKVQMETNTVTASRSNSFTQYENSVRVKGDDLNRHRITGSQAGSTGLLVRLFRPEVSFKIKDLETAWDAEEESPRKRNNSKLSRGRIFIRDENSVGLTTRFEHVPSKDLYEEEANEVPCSLTQLSPLTRKGVPRLRIQRRNLC